MLTMWSIWCVLTQIFLLHRLIYSMPDKSPSYKINPKPCSGNMYEGTCMFVWECIRSEGQHIGMCVDTFMFGSCCAHNLTDNIILPEPLVYNKPTKQFQSSKNKHPTSEPSNRPNYSGAIILHRPHGTGTLVIRPSINQKPYNGYKPSYSALNTSVKLPSLSEHSVIDQNASNDITTGLWNTQSYTSQWHVTTQPNFITKPKPPLTDKIYSSWYKPKPTKKPIFLEPQTKPDLLTTISKTQTSIKQTSIITSTTTTTTTTSTTSTTTSSPKTNNFSQVLPRDTLSAAKGVECGMPMIGLRPETRIVGGKNAVFGRWPWQVSVRRTSFFGFSSTHRCGGAVINENWIATAGHCVDDLLTSQIRIRVGEFDFSHVQEQLPYVERAVAKKVVHPKYNFFTYEYDLALVKLDFRVDFDSHISPICLPATDALLVGENATVTGWGRLSEGGTLPSVLQEVLVPIVSNDRCQTMFLQAGRHEYVPDIFLCAGHESGGQDSCQGDSGGPLQVKGKDGHFFLAGIISWGIGCAEANLPGVCTRISKFTQWILETVS